MVLQAENGRAESQLGFGELCSSAEGEPPPTVVAVAPSMHRQLPYFPFYSPLSHKLRFNKWKGGLFFPIITHGGGSWGRLPSIGSKGWNHNHPRRHSSALPNSTPHSNSWSEVCRAFENIRKMQLLRSKGIINAANGIKSDVFPTLLSTFRVITYKQKCSANMTNTEFYFNGDGLKEIIHPEQSQKNNWDLFLNASSLSLYTN